MLRALLLSLCLATPAAAYIVEVPYYPNGEKAHVTGPYARYAPHVLKFSARRYAVLFQPGFVDAGSAIRAVAPLCAAEGRRAAGVGLIAPADIVIADGETDMLQGYRVDCK